MNLKELFKKLFNNDKNYVYSLASYGDLLEIPKREDYNGDLISNAKIDEYKKIFENILYNTNTLTSNYLHNKDFQSEININLDLLMRLSFNIENELYTEDEKNINSLITYAKLQLYLEKIIKLEKEIKYSFIALNELKKELLKRFRILHINNRKNAINDELNNLAGILCVLNNQKYAIYNKVEALSIEYKTNYKSNNDNVEESKYLRDKYNKLLKYASILLDENYIDEINQYDSLIIKVAALERLLEVYVYHHKNDIDLYKKELTNYKYRIHRNSLIHKKPGITEEEFKELELKMRVFYEFGDNDITKEDITDLYETKFKYRTIDIYYKEETPFVDVKDDKRDFIEYSVYSKIIMNMIEALVRNKNNIMSNKIMSSQFKTIDKDFWNKFIELFDDNSGVYNTDDYILSNPLVLSFLLAIYNKNLYSFFSTRKIKTGDYLNTLGNKKDNYFLLEKEIPLDTYCILMNIIDSIPDININDFLKSLSYFEDMLSNITLFPYFYSLILRDVIVPNRDINEKNYRLPNGIVKLAKNDLSSNPKDDNAKIINKMVSGGSGYNIITPNSLEYFDSSIFSNMVINKLLLNEGLTKINVNSFSIKTKEIVIPSTLDVFPLYVIDFDYLDKMIFSNINESKTFNNRDFIKSLLKKIVYIEEDSGKRNFKSRIKIVYYFESELGVPYEKNINIEKLIKDLYKENATLVKQALKKNEETLLDLFYDLLTNKFISNVYKFTGYKMCSDSKINNVLRKKVSPI